MGNKMNYLSADMVGCSHICWLIHSIYSFIQWMFLSTIHAASTGSSTGIWCQIRHHLCPHGVLRRMEASRLQNNVIGNILRKISQSSHNSTREGLFRRSGETPKKEPRAGGEEQYSGEDLQAEEGGMDNLTFKCLLSHNEATWGMAPYATTYHTCHCFWCDIL